jgi:hypothetical protein
MKASPVAILTAALIATAAFVAPRHGSAAASDRMLAVLALRRNNWVRFAKN